MRNDTTSAPPLRPGHVARCIAVAATLAAATLLGACGDNNDTRAPQSVSSSPEQIARGKYLAAAADCAACHTAQGGAPFTGGTPLATPFGTLYGSNITPDPDTGIGRWTSNDFYRAVTAGKAPGGHYLYPAMPYTSYHAMTRADSDALYAYFMHLPPVKQKDRDADLKFPYNMRIGMMAWNVLFLKSDLPAASQGQSADWLRGRYLVNTLGHCGECHTPRGKLGQLDLDRPLAGAALERIAAPDITPQALAARGWTPADLQVFLRTGLAKQGSAYGGMYPVVHFSTQYLTPDDLRAMSVFLMGDAPPAAQPVKPGPVDGGTLRAGRDIYLNVCAGCHRLNGQGKPHTVVGMDGNSTVRQADARNLIVSILDGLPEQNFPGLESMQAMPGFASQLSDEETAQLANYLRATWGDQPANVTAAQVKALRQP